MAYASLVCLINTLDENIQLNLIPQNRQYIRTLLQEASFFQEFIENSSNKSSETAKYLESLHSRIRDVAYKALDIIDSNVANRFLKKSEIGDEVCFISIWRILRSICRSIPQSNRSFTSLFQKLDKVMKEINSIKLEAMQIQEKEKDNKDEENKDEPQVQSSISLPVGSSRPPSHGMTTNTMVGLDDQLKELRTRLVSGSSQREIVGLVGMGGIGKTTLAQKVYDNKSILSHFDICGWATVSQEHNVRNILLGLLDSMGKLTHELRIEDNGKLKDVLYKNLKHMRYLIALDDMWNTKVLDDLRQILVNDENGSRILLTTRLKDVAEFDKNCPPHHMRFLNDEESWDLFCKVFGNGCCPLELEKVGKEIVRNCGGLPLAVNVIGGHLSKAIRTKHHWRSVAKNLSETIALEDDGQYSRVLSLSYKYLPHHLKGCFLYMSIFPENYEIEVSILVHLWIATGLIKQETSKNFEDVAKYCFLDLVERNLILVSKRKYNGKIVRCRIHDLIRDLCVKEAKNEKFCHITDTTLYLDYRYVDYHVRVDVSPHSRPFRALYLYKCRPDLPSITENLITNIRFLYYHTDVKESHSTSKLFFPDETAILAQKFLHLHTVHVFGPFLSWNIREMTQLRHVKADCGFFRPATEIDRGNSVIVLGKLQTLSLVKRLILMGDNLQWIQNVKKLGLKYHHETDVRGMGLDNLERLSKLESLQCWFHGAETKVVPIHDMSFPHSIKKLTLYGSRIPWKDMTVVGLLPNLQVLKLFNRSFIGEEWEPNEEEFVNLKTLYLSFLDVVHWRAEAVHFPILQHLFISDCTKLQEIPCGIGEIPSLQLIDVRWCRESVISSARKIEEKQRDFGNEGL